MASEFDLSGSQLWPTMVFRRKWADYATYVDALCDHLYAVQTQSKENIASGVAIASKSMDGLFESDFDLLEAQVEPIQRLRQWIVETVAMAVGIANGHRGDPNLIRVEFTESWCHISNQGGFHDAHYHGNCSWCGIFYVRSASCRPTDATGAGNGISRFYSPIPTGGAIQDFGGQYLSSNRIDVTPQDGLLILFPSYLLHSGLPYKGDDDRLLIAFNTKSYL